MGATAEGAAFENPLPEEFNRQFPREGTTVARPRDGTRATAFRKRRLGSLVRS
jgi:hypothetical protein